MGALGAVSVVVAEPHGSCPLCSGRMLVQKTVPRIGRTVAHGCFEAQETVHVCAAECHWPSGARVTQRAASLSEALVPRANFGYDVMVLVGRERFLGHRQREEIQATLRTEYGIPISTGEVSTLTRRFVGYLARLHRARAPQLRQALESDGGWPMHIDATGEHGRGTLFVVMAGWRRWVLGSWKLATERADLLAPRMSEMVRLFGWPCALMRDMGKAVTDAGDALVAERRRQQMDLPVLACHQHFLADIGKDLLKPAHNELRDSFRCHKVLPKLRALVRELGVKIGPEIAQAREAVLDWQQDEQGKHVIDGGLVGLAVVRALGQWVLDYKADASGFDFPYDRPFLDLYRRCLKTRRALEAHLCQETADQDVLRNLRRLHAVIIPVISDVPFGQLARRLSRRAALHDELRQVLRLAGPAKVDVETGSELERMKEALERFTVDLRKRRPSRGPAKDQREAVDLILEHLDRHGATLWGHEIILPEAVGGGSRLVDRTNNLLESFFKGAKHQERRRSGRKSLGHDLECLPAEALLAYNLNCADYVEILCGNLEQLPAAFAQLDRERERRRLAAEPSVDDEPVAALEIASASLSTADRRVVRTAEMAARIEAAARSRAPLLF